MFETSHVKLACCIPYHQDITLHWALDIRRLVLPADHLWIVASHYELDQVREELVKDAIESNATHMLFFDTDIRVPMNGAQLAFSHNYPVVSGLYWSKRGTPAAWDKEGEGYVPKTPGMGNFGLADYTGLGFCLFDMRIMKRLSKPLFVYERADDVVSIRHESLEKMIESIMQLPEPASRKRHILSEDAFFFRKIREEIGIRPLVDGRIGLLHEDRMQLWPDGKVEWLRNVREPHEIGFDPDKIRHVVGW